MSKWIRGRFGRPIAGTMIGLLLISLFLALASPPSYAQLDEDMLNFFQQGTVTRTTPIVIVDYANKSGHPTGMLGRVFADAMTVEMQRSGTFDVIKRSEVQATLEELNMTPPLDYEAQAMVAARLSGTKQEEKCNFTISGEIKSVKINQTPEGTFAEVNVETLIIYRVTRLPLNGARVTQRSSTKIGYVANPDILVQEALQIAAYKTVQTLQEKRVPIGTILTSVREGEVLMKGGKVIGFQQGMELISLRRETVTGRLVITSLNPDQSYCRVLEGSGGVALGDKTVPVFSFESRYGVTPSVKNRVGLQLLALVALGGLGVLIGSDSGDKDLINIAPPTATPLADAVGMEQPYGGNLVRWSRLSNRVIAYVIYRDTNPFAPIAVVDGYTDWYVDSASPLPELGMVMESTEINVEIDESRGTVTAFDRAITYEEDTLELQNADMQVDETSFTVSCRRVPLYEGETCGYRIRTVYMQYDSGGLDEESVGHPEAYRLLLGNTSASSARVTLTMPPTLDSPADNELPVTGNYRCSRVRGATNYCLQFSSDPTFPRSARHEVVANIESEAIVLATYGLHDIYNNPVLGNARVIYWRMGARVAGQPDPRAGYDRNQDGWVFSRHYNFILPPAPPRSRIQQYLDGVPGKVLPSGRQGTRGGFFRR